MILKHFTLSLLTVCIMLASCSSSNKTDSNSPLKNTKWILKTLNGKSVVTLENGKLPFLTLSSEGDKANGSGGCNSFFTTYTITGKALVFGQVASTEMFCQNAMDTESEFFKALGSTQSYKIKENNLYLSDASSKAVASFEAETNK